MNTLTERALIWRETEWAESCPWAFDIVTGRGVGTYRLVALGENYPTQREAFDAACAELKRRAEGER